VKFFAKPHATCAGSFAIDCAGRRVVNLAIARRRATPPPTEPHHCRYLPCPGMTRRRDIPAASHGRQHGRQLPHAIHHHLSFDPFQRDFAAQPSRPHVAQHKPQDGGDRKGVTGGVCTSRKTCTKLISRIVPSGLPVPRSDLVLTCCIYTCKHVSMDQETQNGYITTYITHTCRTHSPLPQHKLPRGTVCHATNERALPTDPMATPGVHLQRCGRGCFSMSTRCRDRSMQMSSFP